MKTLLRPGFLTCSASVLLAGAALAAPTPVQSISAGDIVRHVEFLASDALEGRGTGTSGERKAGEYLAKELGSYGLKPGAADGSFFQSFQVAGRSQLQGEARLRVWSAGWWWEAERGPDWNPFGFSSSLEAERLPLVFAGYGISDGDYDDYAGLDVRGKAVLVLRHEPGKTNNFGRNSLFSTKAETAKKHGAKALLVVSDPVNHTQDDSVLPMGSGGDIGIFAAHVRRTRVEAMFRRLGHELLEVQQTLDRTLKPVRVDLQATIDVGADITRNEVTARNVIAHLPGSDPQLRDEVVVIGAHYDHLGRGGHGGSLARGVRDTIHNGADDNASGTAGLLELAQAFAQQPPRRSLLFVGFSGEERGLLGSQHFVKEPSVPLESIVAMVNLDMIGRLREGRLEVGGVGTSPGFRALALNALESQGLQAKLDPSGFGPSDHASFYGAKVPVLFLFTGLHDDYHRPSDDPHLLNGKGAEQVSRVAFACAQSIADADERPAYVAPRPRLGVVLTRDQPEHGVRVGRVGPEHPAGKAGMRAGDVVLELAGHKTPDLEGLQAALELCREGGPRMAVVERDGKQVVLTVPFPKQ